MNLELLEEIHKKLDDNISLNDISNDLAISKANISLMLRIEKIVTDKFSGLLNDVDTLRDENSSLKELVTKLRSSQNIDIDELKKKLEVLENIEDDYNQLSSEYNLLEDKFSRVPNFIKRVFCE